MHLPSKLSEAFHPPPRFQQQQSVPYDNVVFRPIKEGQLLKSNITTPYARNSLSERGNDLSFKSIGKARMALSWQAN